MRHAVSIVIAFILLAEAFLPSTDKCELIKLVNLIDHYQEVQEDTSLFVFLASHYGGAEKSESHRRDSHDENLPFQERSCCHGLVFFSEQTRFPLLIPEPAVQKQDPFYLAPVAPAYRMPVFQPPQS